MPATLDDIVRALAALRSMSPMDAIAWFDTPVVRAVTGTVMGVTQLAGAEQRRVALILDSGANDVFVSISSTDAGASNGILLSKPRSPLILLHSQVGPLVQQAWFMQSVSSVVYVIEILLREWPRGQKGLANGQV